MTREIFNIHTSNAFTYGLPNKGETDPSSSLQPVEVDYSQLHLYQRCYLCKDLFLKTELVSFDRTVDRIAICRPCEKGAIRAQAKAEKFMHDAAQARGVAARLKTLIAAAEEALKCND